MYSKDKVRAATLFVSGCNTHSPVHHCLFQTVECLFSIFNSFQAFITHSLTITDVTKFHAQLITILRNQVSYLFIVNFDDTYFYLLVIHYGLAFLQTSE